MNIHTHHVGEGINMLDVGEGSAWVDREKKRIPEGGEEIFYSVGIHPMRLREPGEDIFTGIEHTVRLEKVIAIGECGLDRRSPVCMEKQEQVLSVQVDWAEELCKPLIIHCVKAYSELIAIRKRKGTSIPWIIHGYNNNEQILRQLLDHGFYISVGTALLDVRSNAFRLLRTIPLEALFLETDDKEVAIHVIYEVAAGILGMDMATLRERIWRNYIKVFVK